MSDNNSSQKEKLSDRLKESIKSNLLGMETFVFAPHDLVSEVMTLESEVAQLNDLLGRANEYYIYLHSEEYLKDLENYVTRALPQINLVKDDFLYHIVVYTVSKK